MEAPVEWMVRHDTCFALQGAAFVWSDFCLRKILEKLLRPEELVAQQLKNITGTLTLTWLYPTPRKFLVTSEFCGLVQRRDGIVCSRCTVS